MSSQGNERETVDAELKDSSLKWTDDEAKSLLSICQEYHKQNGVDTHFNWGEIADKLGKEHGKKFSGATAKNKFDYMKKTWRLWCKLRMNETGLGWNAAEGAIRATDEWWERKIKEDKALKRFRNYQPDPELSELWDTVYGNIVATGQHCVSANMDVPSQGTQRTTESVQRSFEDLLVMNDNFDENELLRELTDGQPTQALDNGSQPLEVACKDTADIGGSKRPAKRKKKGSTGAVYLQEQIVNVESSTHRVLSMLEGEVNSNVVAPSEKMYTLDDAIEIIYRMVNDGELQKQCDLFCYAVDELNKESSRRLFMTLKTDEDRLAWLRYKFGRVADKSGA